MLEKTLNYFRELSKIPRCSKNEKNVIKWLVFWAEENNFDYKIDRIWNILITVSATKWKENSETIVLQWHVDIVCVKTKTSNHNFKSDWIELIETNNGFLTANWTTLWADNWIWVSLAMACAFLVEHPKLELLFTIDEEKWMTWVLNLEEWFITWTKLINIDTEEEWEIIIWSAWWARLLIEWKFDIQKTNNNIYKFNFNGLKWWHSWLEINKSKWNIVDALFQFLNFLDVKFELSQINSWVAENVIAKELVVIISFESIENLEEKINEFKNIYKSKYLEDNFDIFFEKIETEVQTIWYEFSNKLMNSVLKSNSWVYKMSEDIEWFVLTSQNLWIIKLLDWNLKMEYLCRSSLNKDLEILINQNINSYWDYLSVSIKDEYPGWAEDINSDLIKIVKENYEELLWNKIKISWIHAWLECWVILWKMPRNSKAISIWPNIYWAHSINEKCEIKSIWIIANVLKKILKDI